MAAYVPPGYGPALRIVRIDVNGTLTSRDLLMGEFEDMPRIARGATDPRVTYVSSDPSGGNTDIMWRRFGLAGELLADALLAEVTYSYFGHPRPSRWRRHPRAAGHRPAGPSLSIVRVGPDGQIRHAPVRHPPRAAFGIGYHDMVRRGPDVIVSWVSFGGPAPWVGLARITP